MPQRAATIESLPAAFEVVKAMQADGLDWGEGYRPLGRQEALACVDGGSGLLVALPMVYDKIPVQRCWAHKIRNVLNKVRKADETSAKADLHAVMNADTAMKARSAASASPSAGAKPTPPPSPVCATISTSF